MLRFSSILLLWMIVPFLGHGQKYKNIKIAEDPVSRRGLCEPSIAINRENPNNIVAAAILDNIFYSFDGGETWARDTVISSYGVWGDPVLLSDYLGNLYFFHLSDPTGDNWSSDEILDRIVCQKSEDGGKTWNDGSYMGFHHPKDQDKEWADADPVTHRIYSSWTQFDKYGSREVGDSSNILFSYSDDQGQSWTKSVRINQYSGNCLDDDGTTEGAVPAAGPNGEAYIAWSLNEKIYFDRIDSMGNSLQIDKVVADQPGGWDIDIPGIMRCNGMPVTVCDLSDGPNRGTVYVNWVDEREGNHDVWVSKSADRGDTWSEPIRVNNDDSERPQFLTWMSCDPVTGYLYCIFYDRRNTEGNSTEVYFAHSEDGGESWKNEKLSETAFMTNELIFFGDYNDIDAYDGKVRPIWTRLEADGNMGVWTALIDMKKRKDKK